MKAPGNANIKAGSQAGVIANGNNIKASAASEVVAQGDGDMNLEASASAGVSIGK